MKIECVIAAADASHHIDVLDMESLDEISDELEYVVRDQEFSVGGSLGTPLKGPLNVADCSEHICDLWRRWIQALSTSVFW